MVCRIFKEDLFFCSNLAETGSDALRELPNTRVHCEYASTRKSGSHIVNCGYSYKMPLICRGLIWFRTMLAAAVASQKALAQYFCGNVTFVLEYLHHDFLRITFEFSVSKTTLRTTKLPSSRVLRLQQAQTKNSYRYGR